jgi:hypothetical protein
MDLDHWYCCTACGYMYTPQQVQALIQLARSRSETEEVEPVEPESIPCRKRGCPGRLAPSDVVYRDPRR